MYKKILLVDDNEADREIFMLALRKIDGSIICEHAHDGMAALEILRADNHVHPDLIFMDMIMPRMDGIECLTEIKADPLINHIPVMIFSLPDSDEIREKMRQAGAAAYIVKPDSFKSFVDILRFRLGYAAV